MDAYRVAYDGTAFRGFQRQPHGETVEDTIFITLKHLGVEFADGKPIGYSAAGRTDAGVSACAQTIGFVAPEWMTITKMNEMLPDTIWVWAHASVDSDFHARFGAAARQYRYFLSDSDLNETKASRACSRLSGKHDFHNLTPDTKHTVRTVEVAFNGDNTGTSIDCIAAGFPRQLVRRIVTVVCKIATGRRSMAFIDTILGDEPCTGSTGVSPAPAEQLLLLDVSYPNVVFQTDQAARMATDEVFSKRMAELQAQARVFATLSTHCLDERDTTNLR